MKFDKTTFKRLFSVNFCKNLRLELARMSFTGLDDGGKGDIYPLLGKTERWGWEMEERLLCSLTPYMNVELASKEGPCGVAIRVGTLKTELFIHKRRGEVMLALGDEALALPSDSGAIISLQICPGFIDVYSRLVGANSFCSQMTLLHSFSLPGLKEIMCEEALSRATVAILTPDIGKMYYASAFMDCGVAQADPRPVKYENGEVLINEGKVYFTFSARAEHGTYQGVMSWVPGTMQFSLVGCLFYAVGDGLLGDDVAASLKLDRRAGLWRIYYASFSHGHVIASAVMAGDVRFGVNIVDARLMPSPPSDMDGEVADLLPYGKEGDEDPDLLYDEERGKWLLTFCRLFADGGKKKYRYLLFESDRADGDFAFVASAESGEETGGNMVRIDGELLFICGNAFDKRSDYRVYRLPDLKHYENMRFDYDDGGFRGWGTVIPVCRGSRTRYFHLTFDRVKHSSYNWSYGNLYCFEAMKDGE